MTVIGYVPPAEGATHCTDDPTLEVRVPLAALHAYVRVPPAGSVASHERVDVNPALPDGGVAVTLFMAGYSLEPDVTLMLTEAEPVPPALLLTETDTSVHFRMAKKFLKLK